MTTLFSFKNALPIAAVLSTLATAGEVQMQTERVALFKNGYACVQLQGKLPEGQRQIVQNVPLPVLGAFWCQAPTRVQRLEGREREVEVALPRFSHTDLLKANEGKCAIIELNNDRMIQGIVSFPSQEPKQGSFIIAPKEQREENPHVVVLNTFQGTSVGIATGMICSVTFPAGEQPVLPSRKIKLAELEVELAEPAPGGELRISCLAQGISWLPTYSLELGEDEQAALSCKATIINDLVDMEHVHLELVSGAPSLGRALVPSVLAHMGNMEMLLKELGDEREDSGVVHALMTNNATFARSGLGGVPDFSDTEALAASVGQLNRAEDLFYYSIPDFTCRRGDTAMRKVFSLSVPYRHVYTCAVPNQDGLMMRSRRGMPIAQVFHCVRLTNTGELPWSTGILTCTSGGRLVARSTLPFAAAGQEALLQLSRTLDADVSCREQLVFKGRSASRARAHSEEQKASPSVYCGFLTLHNKSAKPMDMELTKAISGTAKETSHEGEISVSPSYSGNAHSLITWKVRLEPGEKKVLKYSYDYQE